MDGLAVMKFAPGPGEEDYAGGDPSGLQPAHGDGFLLSALFGTHVGEAKHLGVDRARTDRVHQDMRREFPGPALGEAERMPAFDAQ